MIDHSRIAPGSRAAAVVAALWLALAPALAAADEASNWERLRSMPRERREALLDNLKELDALSPADRAAVRALDGRMRGMPPADQARYYSVLRRYHRWLATLTDAQRAQLKAAGPDERLKLVAKFRADERAGASPRATPPILRVAEFGAATPFEVAHQVLVWNGLNADQRKTLANMPDVAAAEQKLRELGKGLDLRAETRQLKRQEDELLAQQEEHLAKLESYVQQGKSGWVLGPLKKKDAPKDARRKRVLAENYYFIAHPPHAVAAHNLVRFGASLPPWIRADFDDLPPDEARRRLTVLYRLLYPAGHELPASKPAPAAKEAPVPKAKPARGGRPAKSGGAQTPF